VPLVRASGRSSRERGVVLLWGAIGTMLVLGIVLTGSQKIKALQDASGVHFAVEAQARQVAESGLVNALAWLRRQPTQPVSTFAPQRDLLADPPIDETDDPAVGLVRAFEIAPGIWGQFLVRKGQLAERFVDSNKNGYCDPSEKIYDDDGDRKRTMAWGTRDLSSFRGASAGGVWHLESEGRIFKRSDADQALGEGPNVQIAMVRLATQVRRLTVTLPGSAALIQSLAEEVDVKKGSWITSPVQAIGYRAGTGNPKISSGAKVTAPVVHGSIPALLPTGGWMDGGKRRISVEEIFGVGMSTLRAMADVSTGTVKTSKGWKKQRLDTTIPDNALVVYTAQKAKGKSSITFDKTWPLRGRGIVVIDGDVDFKKGSASQFDGILVVLGEFKVHGPAKFRGTVIATKKSHIHGKKNDVQIQHDPALVQEMINHLAKYRRFKSSFEPVPAMLDERPNEQFQTERRLGGLDYDGNTLMTPFGS
jgi:hypothetical protein